MHGQVRAIRRMSAPARCATRRRSSRQTTLRSPHACAAVTATRRHSVRVGHWPGASAVRRVALRGSPDFPSARHRLARSSLRIDRIRAWFTASLEMSGSSGGERPHGRSTPAHASPSPPAMTRRRRVIQPGLSDVMHVTGRCTFRPSLIGATTVMVEGRVGCIGRRCCFSSRSCYKGGTIFATLRGMICARPHLSLYRVVPVHYRNGAVLPYASHDVAFTRGIVARKSGV